MPTEVWLVCPILEHSLSIYPWSMRLINPFFSWPDGSIHPQLGLCLVAILLQARLSSSQPLIQLAGASPRQPLGDQWLLDLPCPPSGCAGTDSRVLSARPELQEAHQCTPSPLCLAMPLGRLNSARPSLTWPRGFLNAGLSPSSILTQMEQNPSTLCPSHHPHPAKHIPPNILAKSVEHQGRHLNMHLLSAPLHVGTGFPAPRTGLPSPGARPGPLYDPVGQARLFLC